MATGGKIKKGTWAGMVGPVGQHEEHDKHNEGGMMHKASRSKTNKQTRPQSRKKSTGTKEKEGGKKKGGERAAHAERESQMTSRKGSIQEQRVEKQWGQSNQRRVRKKRGGKMRV